MTLDDLWRFMENVVFTEASTATLFNQYSDVAPGLDKAAAIGIRRANLNSYCSSFTRRPTTLLVGEAPGPKGCRFSGVPFTSEEQLVAHTLPFKGRQSSNRATPYKESSATTFWAAMKGFEARAFAWNCVPFHPHEKDELMSIR